MSTVTVSCTGCERTITTWAEARRVRCRACGAAGPNPRAAPHTPAVAAPVARRPDADPLVALLGAIAQVVAGIGAVVIVWFAAAEGGRLFYGLGVAGVVWTLAGLVQLARTLHPQAGSAR